METMGIVSLIPAIVAIVLAFSTRNVIISLFFGSFIGILIMANGHLLESVEIIIGEYIFAQSTDSYNAAVLALLVFIGGFVALVENSGGASAFASKIAYVINTKVKSQLSAWLGGIIIFFSDLGTPLIIGPIFEPIFDKLKVSREKLAWIIDSTSSPVAVMIPFIGWGVYIMGLINKEYERLGIQESDWDAFMNALPFYIYPILAVLIVPVMLLTKSEFGPMRMADRRVEETGAIYWPHSKPIRKTEKMNEYVENKSKARLIIVPITILLVTLFGLLIPLGFPFKKIDGSAFRVALSTAYLFAAISLILMMVFYKVKKFGEAFDIYVSGMQKMMNVVIILVLAWSLGGVLDKMGTANYLVGIMDGNVPVFLIPAILFVLGAVMSFANGTSWGTFAIMMPLAIPLAYHLDASIYVAIGAVVSGGIFGDHCSPISDSTILSSTGAGCDHVDHNKTQIPIALFNASVTLVAFLIAGLSGSVYTAVIAVILMIIGTLVLSKLSKRKDFATMDKKYKAEY